MSAKNPHAISLSRYIAAIGAEKFAKIYGVTVRRAKSWQYRARRPRPDIAQRIVDDPHSPVTWDSIYRDQTEAAPPPKEAAMPAGGTAE